MFNGAWDARYVRLQIRGRLGESRSRTTRPLRPIPYEAAPGGRLSEGAVTVCGANRGRR